MTPSTWNIPYPPDLLPSQFQRLFLQATLLSKPTALSVWRELLANHAGELEIEHLDHDLRALLPMLKQRLESFGAENHPLCLLGAEAYSLFWLRNLKTAEAARSVASLLQELQIPVIPLKGLALILDYYETPGLRSMEDFDLLVPERHVGVAVQTLQQAGWSLIWPPVPDEKTCSAWHAAELKRADGEKLDLHWHLLAGDCGSGIDETYWNQAKPGSLQETPILKLSLEDLLFHLCAHPLRWSSGGIPLRWMADATIVLRKSGDLDWNRLALLSRVHGMRLFVGSALNYLRENLEAQIPDDFFKLLRAEEASRLERWSFEIITRPHWKTSLWKRLNLNLQMFQKFSKPSDRWRIWLFPRFIADRNRQPTVFGLVPRFLSAPWRKSR